jgi:DNA-directed RNA polymerase specialized sigma54-like protein
MQPEGGPGGLKLSQALVMTPQLQMAIRLLSFGRAELVERELPTLLEQHPLLGSSPREPTEFDVDEEVVVVREGPGFRALPSALGLPAFSVGGHAYAFDYYPTGPTPEDRPDPMPGAKFAAERADELRAALWVLRALEQRGRTYARVAQALVERRPAFFEEGPGRLEPVTYRELAEDVGMHESTIDRVVTGKALRCSHGAYALDALVRKRGPRRPRPGAP